ncbi:phospho-acceptor domain-containing protein [Flavobacterium endophyticum]|uniref:histidine kinase n=1 Tax=Flavobacterium endophyticum TaxID=1540163 RepID=A0A495M787_9FLAO|nr:HAMP domain-containing sensor histidine kinase [Flavobacterium endophyticum]RKS21947.1 phospho-acceptor domain-containing protein [Flavobacterium endophyticum]
MKRKILLAFVLMSFCVAGIAALQLYYNYATYTAERRQFERDCNEALEEAVDSSFARHRRIVVGEFKGWLYDPSFIKITARWNPDAKQTVFTIKETEPSAIGQSQFSMGIEDFKERLDSITPKGRTVLVNHMARQVDTELKKGYIWFYTQKLGDSLNKLSYDMPLELGILKKEYQASLQKRGISLSFDFNRKPDGQTFQTKKVNISLRRPHKQKLLQATIVNTDLFLLRQLKWVLIGSVLLILITLSCFWYTFRLLLTQHKINTIKDDFINNMTHEINTPLTSIAITAEALKKFNHDKETQENYIEIIRHQSGKLISLTDEILAAARLESSEMELKDTIAISTLLQEIVAGAEGSAQISISSEEDSEVKGNKKHLSRAIANLIDNAIKYAGSEKPIIEIQSFAEHKQLTIRVADNGPGISDEHKEAVFSPFYRIPSGNVHDVKGYGLGLNYVRKVIAAHKGSISLKDNVPNGSVFTIKLPLS